MAIRTGNVRMVQSLISMHASLDIIDLDHNSVFHYAAASNKEVINVSDIVNYILKWFKINIILCIRLGLLWDFLGITLCHIIINKFYKNSHLRRVKRLSIIIKYFGILNNYYARIFNKIQPKNLAFFTSLFFA